MRARHFGSCYVCTYEDNFATLTIFGEKSVCIKSGTNDLITFLLTFCYVYLQAVLVQWCLFLVFLWSVWWHESQFCNFNLNASILALLFFCFILRPISLFLFYNDILVSFYQNNAPTPYSFYLQYIDYN